MKISEMTDKELIAEVESHYQNQGVVSIGVKDLMIADACEAELEKRGYNVEVGSTVFIEKDEEFEE